jgi:hypothetical protein
MNKTPVHNKHYSKCGFACSLKHLETLHTFVQVDSFVLRNPILRHEPKRYKQDYDN